MSLRLRFMRLIFRFVQFFLLILLAPITFSSCPFAKRFFRLLAKAVEGSFALFPVLTWLSRCQVNQEKVQIAGVNAIWFKPENPRYLNKVVIYVHGGFFFLGSGVIYSHWAAQLAYRVGCPVLFVEYALAPEATFPQARNELEAVYRYLIQNGYLPQDIVMGGDSAGACLTLNCLMKMRDAGLPVPASAILASGVYDFTLSSKSVDENWLSECIIPSILGPKATRCLALRLIKGHYAKDYALDSPQLSPFFGELKGLPPLFFSCSQHELLRDDTLRMIEKARAASVAVTPHISHGTPHVNGVFFELYPEARAELVALTDFIRGAFD